VVSVRWEDYVPDTCTIRMRPPPRDAKVANRNVRDFGWEIAHGAVTRRPPISLDTMVPRTKGYTHDGGVWDLSIVRTIFCRAVPNLS
jgi:hypothetical protein